MSSRWRKWTKEDTRHLLLVGPALVGIFSLLALISGGEVVTGAIVGLFMWGVLIVASLALVATGNFRD